MRNERTQQLKIDIHPRVIKDCFLNAIQEVEALREFYVSFRDTWSKNKVIFEQQYAIALSINDIIENLLDSETPEKDYGHIKESQVENHLFKDIIELRITNNDQQVSISYSMNKSFREQDPQKARSQKNKFDQQEEIFVRSILSNIVIIFERYFAQIYEFMVVLNPESYFEGKTIKLNDLFHCSVKQMIITEVRKQVSDNMYDSLKTLDTMKAKSSFNIDRYIPIQKDFEEIYYRRNIFVHNSGVVNDIYLSSIAEEYKSHVKRGDKLICDDAYVENAILVLKKIICVLLYEFLFTIKAENSSYDVLADIAFSALSNEEYSFCEYIYDILKRHRGFDFADRTMYEVNYMIAMKQQQKSISKYLEEFDTSAMQEQFIIAKHCLMEDNEAVYSLLNQIYPDRIPAEAIRDWPLFIDFRKSEEYAKFLAEHKSDFEQYAFETDEAHTSDEITDSICDEGTIID